MKIEVQGTHKFEPKNQCVYCGATAYDASGRRKLGDEHIIPETIGGIFILPNSVCQSCEKEINRAETALYRGGFSAVKRHFKFKGKKRSKRNVQDTLPIFDCSESESGVRIDVPVDEYPGLLLLQIPPVPKIINERWTPFCDLWSHWVNASALVSSSDLPGMVLEFGTKHFALVSTNCLAHARCMAKIAHASAFAAFDKYEFEPLLCDFILGRADSDCFSYFGRSAIEPIKDGSAHTVQLRCVTIPSGRYIVASVRLFACLNSPAFDIVVGKLLSEEVALPVADLKQNPPAGFEMMIGTHESYDPRSHRPTPSLPIIGFQNAELRDPKLWFRIKIKFD